MTQYSVQVSLVYSHVSCEVFIIGEISNPADTCICRMFSESHKFRQCRGQKKHLLTCLLNNFGQVLIQEVNVCRSVLYNQTTDVVTEPR